MTQAIVIHINTIYENKFKGKTVAPDDTSDIIYNSANNEEDKMETTLKRNPTSHL